MDENVSGSVNEIKEDIKVIKDKLHSIDITMVENTNSLKEHMAQTMLLREIVLPLHAESIERKGAMSERKRLAETMWKVLGTLVGIASLVMGYLKYKGAW